VYHFNMTPSATLEENVFKAASQIRFLEGLAS